MPDDDTIQQPVAPPPGVGAGTGTSVDQLINTLLSQASADPMAAYQQYMGQQDQTPVKRSITSLLGEMVSGGQGPGLTPAQQELEGNRSLLNFGLNMLAASGPSQIRRGFGQIFAQGLAGAQESAQNYEGQIGAWQAQQLKNAAELQSMRLNALKEAIPLLRMQQVANAPNPLAGTPGGGPVTGSAAGATITPYIAKNLPAGVSTAEDQMVRTVLGEAADQGVSGQQAVASVIKNRMDASGQNAQDVIFRPNAFEPWNTARRSQLEGYDPTSKQYQDVLNNVVRPVMNGTAKDPTNGATYFYNPSLMKDRGQPQGPSWAQGQTPTTTIGAHSFYKLPYGGSGTTTATAAAQPATPPAAPPSMQIGGAPPAPPGVTTTQPAGPLQGFGRAIAGTEGVTGPEQFTVAAPPTGKGAPLPAGKLQTTGKPPGVADASAILGGMQQAAATRVIPGTGLEAGPGGAVASLAQPDQGFGSKPSPSYSFGGPAAPAPTVTPPAGQPQAPTQQPRDNRPDPQLSRSEYITKYLQQPTQDELAQGITVAPPAAAYARAQSDLAQAKQDRQAAAVAFQNAAMSSDPAVAEARATAQANDADQRIQAANKALSDLEMDATKTSAANQQAWLRQRREELGLAYDKMMEPINQVKLEQAKAQSANESKVMDGLNETYETARTAADQIDLARSLSRSAGDPTFWQAVQSAHPDLVRWVANLGGLSDQQMSQMGLAGATDAAMNKLISMARTGSGFQRMTNLDVQILSSQSPAGTDPQAWREAKLAYLQSYMARQMNYVDAVRSLRADGVPLYQAQRQASADQGDIVPQIPTFTDGPAGTAADQRIRWAQRNLSPNTFFRAPDGQMIIYSPQAQQQQQRPQSQTPQVPMN